jgi:hypothetical protein
MKSSHSFADIHALPVWEGGRSDTMFWSWDVSFDRILGANGFASKLGLPVASRSHMPFELFMTAVAEEDQDKVRQGFDAALWRSKTLHIQFRVSTTSTQPRTICLEAQTVRNQMGCPIQLIGMASEVVDAEVW